MTNLILLFSILAGDSWTYDPTIGFVNSTSSEIKSPEDFLILADSCAKEGLSDQAIFCYDLINKSIKTGTVPEQSLFNKSSYLYQIGNLKSSHLAFRSFIKSFPSSKNLLTAKKNAMETAWKLIEKGEEKSVLGIIPYKTSQTGIKLLKESLDLYPFETFAPDFAFNLGLYYFKVDKDLFSAEQQFLSVIDRYKSHNRVSAALLMLGEIQMDRFKGIKYDSKELKDAILHLNRIMEEYPKSPEVNEAIKRRYLIIELLAEKEFQSAQYYFERNHFNAGCMYLRSLMKKYPNTKASEKAQKILKDAEDMKNQKVNKNAGN